MIKPEFCFAWYHPVLNQGRDFQYLFMAGPDVFCPGGSDYETEDIFPVPGDEVKYPVLSATPIGKIAPVFEIADSKPDGTPAGFGVI